jgi:phage baseplate assembly protein W
MTTSFGRGLRLDDGDLVMSSGRLQEVEAVANLSQALTLRVLTPFGSDPFNTDYGLDISEAFIEPNTISVVRQLIQLNLVRTLATDPRVRDVREITFDDDPDAQRNGAWTVRVELDTVGGDALTLLTDVGVRP